MLKVIPQEIKKIFVCVFLVGLLAFFFGFIFDIREIYFAFCIGIIFSIISNIFLLISVYLMVYRSCKSYISFIRFIVSYMLYAISMYISYILCENVWAIILNAVGLCCFKLICYCMYILKFKRKKVHKK